MSTRAQIAQTYLVYRDTGNIKKVSEITGLPESTLFRWAKEYNWKDRRKEELEDEENGALIPYGVTDEALPPISEYEEEVLNQVRMVEQRCEAALTGKVGENEEGLYPKTFDSAMKALKICWDTRDRIINKAIPGKGKGGITIDTEKVNIIADLQAFATQLKEEREG